MKAGVTALALLCVLAASSAQAETLSACDQKIDYKIQSAKGDFGGAWVGKWDTGLCGAIIVESIDPSGTIASVIYVWGSVTGQYSMKAGNRRETARIDGNKLTVKNNSMTAEFVLSNASTAAGTYTSRYGLNRGHFSKQ